MTLERSRSRRQRLQFLHVGIRPVATLVAIAVAASRVSGQQPDTAGVAISREGADRDIGREQFSNDDAAELAGRADDEDGSHCLGYFARISASRFARYALYSAWRAGSVGVP